MRFNSSIRKVLTTLLLILIGILLSGLPKKAANSVLENQGSSLYRTYYGMDANLKLNTGSDMYVPSITLLKASSFNGGDCSAVPYTYTVENTSDAGEVFVNVEITDSDFGGIVANGNPDSGDVNANGNLDPGEIWIYSYLHNVTQNDLDNGSIGTQPANVMADVQGQGIQVTDISHPTDPLGSAPTIVDLLLCQNPSIGLVMSSTDQDLDGDGCVESFLYDFTVINNGGVSLQNVVLEANFLGGIVFPPLRLAGSDPENDGILSPGEQWQYQALYGVEPQPSDTFRHQSMVTAETVVQEVQVMDLSHPDNFLLDDTTSSPYDVTCNTSHAIIGLVKQVTGRLDTGDDGCFDTIEYTFTVRNEGDINLDSVVLYDELLGGVLSGPVEGDDGDGILENETWIYRGYQYGVSQQDVINGIVENQAVVTAEPENTNFVVFDNSDESSFVEDDPTIESMEFYCAPPGIGLIKRDGAGDFLVDLDGDNCNESIYYVFEVVNTGGVDLDEVVLTDDLLGGVIDGPIQGDTNNDGELSVGETWIYEAYYPITQADIDAVFVDNQAMVRAEQVETDDEYSDLSHSTFLDQDGPTTASTNGGGVCVAEARIGLIKTAPIGSLRDLDGDGCPETLRYEFTVENTGAIDLQQIVITDANITTPITGPTGDDGNDTVLSIGETWSFEAFYSITEQNAIDGFVRNQAEVEAVDTFFGNTVSDLSDHTDNNENRITETIFTETVCFAQAGIGLIKVADTLEDLDNDGCLENISYIFTVENTGAIPLEQVVLTDFLLGPNPIEGPLPGLDINGDGILSPGETWVYQAYYPITAEDIADTEVRNQANVVAFEQGTSNSIADDSDDNSFNENDETITSVVGACPAEAAITITKSATPMDADGDGCPETIQYSFIVDNTGAISLYQVAITDDMLSGGVTGPLNNSDIGNDNILSTTEAWTYEATYTITQADYEEGLVTNQAQVSALEVSTDNPIEAESEEVITSFADVCEEPIDPTNPVDPNFEIFNGITPNGDGLNDFFEIRGIENYPNNLLKVFNRWGVLVFEAEGYGIGNSLFSGQSEGRATIAKERALPTGTYFYSLTFTGNNPGQEVYSGYLYLSRD